MSQRDPRSIINQEPMTSFQIVAVGICIVLNALDGFDVLAITFAAPGISQEWAVGPGALGVVISTGLAGMFIGSLVLAPFADVVGRRRVIIVCLSGMTAGMLLSSTSQGIYSLALWRVITGIGMGGMLAAITAMVAEYANDRHRNWCVALVGAGYPLGGVLGGAVAVWLLQHYNWRSVFIFGGVTSALIMPLVLLRLPESIEFLAAKRRANALEQINGLLRRMGHPIASTLRTSCGEAPKRLLDIFSPELAPRTVSVCAAYFFHILTTYYVLGWLPSMVTALGFPASTAASVSVWASIGGIISGLLFGYISRFVGLKQLVMAAMVGTASLLAVFGRTAPDLHSLQAVAFVLGFFMFGAVVCHYAIFARVFPTHVRVTGTGFSIGVGRIGAMMGPAIGGWLMLTELSRSDTAVVMASGSILAALATLSLRKELVTASYVVETGAPR